MKKNIIVASALSLFIATGCCNSSDTECSKAAETKCANNQTDKDMKQVKFQKKYTNADFYTDGKFNQDVALKAIKDLIEFYGYPFTPYMEKNIWVADFGLGDFENTGMGGIFWMNDKENGYFAHHIYLLPGQMIPEHKHLATDEPAKHETWMVERGMCYNFSEVGEATPNAPEFPESQKSTIISKNFVAQEVGDIIALKESLTYHFLYAGDQGAIVAEWATYHDGAGLRFTNPKAKL